MSTSTNAIEAIEANSGIPYNPNEVMELNPLDENEIVIDPARNSRGYTPEIGDKSLSSLIDDIEENGQTTPCFATVEQDGSLSLYAGFRRARAVQTIAKTSNPKIKLRVLVTVTELTDMERMQLGLSENVFREDMSIMQRVSALKALTDPPYSLPLSAAGKKMNMSKGAASTYLRFDLFPAIAKKALNSGKMGYKAAERFVALLPKAEQLVAEPAETAGALLKKAQDRIAGLVEKELAKTTKVSMAGADRAAGGDGNVSQGGSVQRRASLIVSEIDEQTAVLKEAKTKAAERQTAALAAFKKYVNGGSMKSLLKALAGE